VDLTASYLSDDGIAAASNGRMQEAYRQIERLQTEKKLMEARQVKLSLENTKLNEAYRHAEAVITEGRSVERKERTGKGKQVTGKGRRELEETVVIAEHNNNRSSKADVIDDDESSNLLEGIGLDFETANLLAGLKKSS